jgi:hypothetical protein
MLSAMRYQTKIVCIVLLRGVRPSPHHDTFEQNCIKNLYINFSGGRMGIGWIMHIQNIANFKIRSQFYHNKKLRCVYLNQYTHRIFYIALLLAKAAFNFDLYAFTIGFSFALKFKFDPGIFA